MIARRHRLGAAALFLAAAVSARWQLFSYPGPAFGHYYESTSIARSLAAGHGFANPFDSLATGATAHAAPVFPLLLAGLIRVFGDTPDFALAASYLCILMHALCTVLLLPLSRLLYGDARPGVCAALFAVAVPTIRVAPQSEAIYAAAGGMLFCLASERLLRPDHRPCLRGAAAGVFCGLLLLLNPMLLFVCAAWMAFLLTRLPGRSRAAIALAFLAAAALTILPWTLRNYSRLGAAVLVRDNLGLELYMSNSDCADATDAANIRNGCHLRFHPNFNAREAEMVRNMGEAGYNRWRFATALRWIGDHPARFGELTLRRVREFWFPTGQAASVYEYSLWIVTALSLAGLVCMVRGRNRGAVFLVAALALYPAVYYFIQSSPRYRFPIAWISLLPAGLALFTAASGGVCLSKPPGAQARLVSGRRPARNAST